MRRRLAVALVVLTLVGACGTAPATGGTPAPSSVAVTAAPSRDPVVLVAGLSSPGWALDPLAARLQASGFTTNIFQLPGLGFGDIVASAQALKTRVDQVLAFTGAAKVDLVSHSEGGLVSRYYVKYLGGTAKVGRYVSLGTPQYGTALANLGTFFFNCLAIVACQQMAAGSAFLTNLNAGDDTPGSVQYTAIFTQWDELVRPVWNASLNDGATNALLQSFCWLRVVGHLGLILDGSVYGLVRTALLGQRLSTNCFAI